MRKYDWENLSWFTRYRFRSSIYFIIPFVSFQNRITKNLWSEERIHYYQFTIFVKITDYFENYTESAIKDLNGMESNRCKKPTRKSWTICMGMIVNASSIVNSNVLAASSNVLVDGMKT